MNVGFPSESRQMSDYGEGLEGDLIKGIARSAEQIADVHATLTSPRGDFFRRRLLHLLSGGGLPQEEIENLRKEFGLEESERHLNKFIGYHLIEPISVGGKAGYHRTRLGEQAINAVRELERRIGEERATKIFQSALGTNSIRLFVKVYGSPKEPQGEDIVFTPLEIGQLSTFLPRTVEGIAAIDKLDAAGLVSYLDDGNVHVNPRRSGAFYYYLRRLYQLLWVVRKRSELGQPQG